jgi:cell division protein FtsB
MATDRKTLVKRIAYGALGAVALWFAVEGGEFSTRDLMTQKRQIADFTRATDSLQHFVDSLKRYKTQLERDPVLQERIAREQFGMVRGKELMYRFTDSTVKR